VIAPTDKEFIEIYNPTNAEMTLEHVYLADAPSYYLITQGMPPSGSDFAMKFPSGTKLAAGERLTVALSSGKKFTEAYNVMASTDPAWPDFDACTSDTLMPPVPAMGGSYAQPMNCDANGNGSVTLTNTGEMVVLFAWDGTSPLVEDLDYVVFDDIALGMNKTGITVGGQSYKDDNPATAAPLPGSDQALNRCDANEGTENQSGGNGLIEGHDETSEILSVTWRVSATPTPGQGNICFTGWQQPDSSATTANYGVDFVDSLYGYRVGRSGAVQQTTNGGVNWEDISPSVVVTMTDVAAMTRDDLIVVGGGATVRYTANAGSTWQTPLTPPTGDVVAVSMLSTTQGWIVSNSVGTGLIFNTTNSGSTWSLQHSVASTTLSDVQFLSSTVGWAVGFDGANDVILRTADGGTNWTSSSQTLGRALTSVYFIDAQNGWIVGSGGTVLTTNDGGTNWVDQSNVTTQDLYGVDFVSTTKGWAVGNNGTIIVSSDGGASWTIQTSGTTTALWAVDFVSQTKGWAAGGDANNDVGLVLRTDDGG
jgi:photosystem II stability/assembly factor-like uncharacterized protein